MAADPDKIVAGTVSEWYDAKIAREAALAKDMLTEIRQIESDADGRVERWLGVAERWAEKLKNG